MNRIVETPGPRPASRYAQAVETPPGARLLHISGQVGVLKDGTPAQGLEAQVEAAWANVLAILDAAGMTKDDLVEVIAIVTEPAAVATYRDIRDRVLEGRLTASTLLVCGLASPNWLVEIAARAAKAD